MRPRWHKVFSDLTSHRIRSLLVIASIAVGLFAIGMITTVYVILAEDIRASYEAINPANVQINAALFDDEFVEHIRRMPPIAAAEGAWITSLQVRTASGEWRPIAVKAQDFDAGGATPIGRPILVEGAWPLADREIALDVNRADETGAALGDELVVKLPSGTIRHMRLAAIVHDQTIGATGGDGSFFLAGIQGYVTVDSLPWLEHPGGYNTLYATVREGRNDRAAIRAVADAVLDEFHRNGYETSGSVARMSQEHPNVVYVDAVVAVIFLLGFLVVFLSAFLITNTFSALLNQQVEQIGVMKTLGASRGQIIGLYMILVLVFSLIALLVAMPLSVQAAWAMLSYLSAEVNFRIQEYRVVPLAFIIQAAVALLVPQLAGSVPILQGTRISVREALSGETSAQVEDAGRLYRLLARIRGLPRPVLISLRNTLRRRGRLALTLLTLTLGGAIFIATFNVRHSIEAYVDRLGRYVLADVNLTLNQPYRLERVTGDLLQIPGVALAEGWAGALASVVVDDGRAGETLQLLAPPPDSTLIEPILLEGRWLLPADQNAITLSELFQEIYPELQVGDAIRLRIGLKETDWVIVGFFQFSGRTGGPIAYTNYDALARETSMYGRSASYRIMSEDQDLTLAQQEALGRQIEARLTALGYEINDISAGRSLQQKSSEGLNILTTFLLIMSFLMASVGSIGLMGTMSLNVMERTREIGVMRAIGAANRSIVAIVLLEGVLIGFISWLLSSVVGLALSKQLADAMFQIIFDRNATLDFTALGNLIWLGLVLLLSVLASVVPSYNASRLTVREVLAYE